MTLYEKADREMTQVEKELNSLKGAVEELESIQCEIEQRLNLVLSHAGEIEKIEEVPGPNLVPLALGIYNLVIILHHVIDKHRDMLKRLEL